MFRKQGLFISFGFLFNHESPRRSDTFISTMIVKAAVLAAQGTPKKTSVRDVHAQVDWCDARDVVVAMHALITQGRSEDYVIASGELRTVEDLAQEAFSAVGLNWRDFIEESTPATGSKSPVYCGNIQKIRRENLWFPRYAFSKMVHSMVEDRMKGCAG